jgi:hypothetical protein
MKFKRFFQIVMAISITLTPSLTRALGALSTCKEAISKQEKQKGIPQGLLKAIATVESGISPWAINARGRSHIFHSKEAAAKYAHELVNNGFLNFSIGCMQLHYASHRRHFKSIDAMLEPENNIAHAAKLIKRLEGRYGSFEKAVKLYHSASPTHHNPYQRQVFRLWGKFRGNAQKPKTIPLKAVGLKEATH